MSVPWYADDVDFNHAAAEALCEVGTRLASQLEVIAVARWYVAKGALAQCEGPFADELERRVLQCCEDGSEAADALRAMVAEVRAAQRYARGEQNARVVARNEAERARQAESGELVRGGRS